jgi:NAD(P)-dependent dehydrogenase (short-subunit alcohol dehydrogenase family)
MTKQSKKRVAITGAASGLGRALAQYYAGKGWRVALADINDLRGQETLQAIQSLGVEAFYQHVNVRDDEALGKWKDAIVKRWGGLDVVINNAGVATHGAIDESPIDDWNWVIDINLMGVVRGCIEFGGLFKKQGFGHIVNVASMAGLIHSPEMDSYNVAKAGVVALSDTLKSELKEFNVKVSVACPAFFPTNLYENARSPNPNIKSVLNKLFSQSKLNADDVARIIYQGVEAGKFHILPHRDFAAIWYLKRLSPDLYFWVMEKVSGRKTKGLAKKARAAS